MFAMFVSSAYGAGRPNVRTLEAQVSDSNSFVLYAASTTRNSELFVPSTNVTSLCCLFSDITARENVIFNKTDSNYVVSEEVFQNYEPFIGTASNPCKFQHTDSTAPDSTGSTLPSGVFHKHITEYHTDQGQQGVTGRSFRLPPQDASTTYSYTCRGIWNLHGTLSHSTKSQTFTYQTPSGLIFHPTNSANAHAIEIPLDEDEKAIAGNAASAIFVSALEPNGMASEDYSDRYSFGLDLDVSTVPRVVDEKTLASSNSYFCSFTQTDGGQNELDTQDCECDAAKRTFLLPDQSLATSLVQSQLQKHNLVTAARPCLVFGGKKYAGGLKKWQTTTLASDQHGSSEDLYRPAILLTHVTDQKGDYIALDNTNLYNHTNGATYNIPNDGTDQRLYKPSLSQQKLSSKLALCITWTYTSNHRHTNHENCTSISEADEIQVDADMEYGEATFRWRLQSDSNHTEVFSYATSTVSWGWFPGLVDVSVNMGKHGQPFRLNPDPLPSIENVQSHLPLWNDAEFIKPSDTITVRVPTNGYVCYGTVNFAAEDTNTANRFPNMCRKVGASMGCVIDQAVQSVLTAVRKDDDFSVHAIDFASTLQTVVLQNCNSDVELDEKWGRDTAKHSNFLSPTNPNTGNYRQRCGFSSAMLPGHPISGQVTGDLPSPCVYSDIGNSADKLGIPLFATTAQDQTIQQRNTQFLFAGDGLVEVFPFNAAPVFNDADVAVEYYFDDDSGVSSSSPGLKSSPTDAAHPASTLVINVGGSTTDEQALTRSFCYTVSDGTSTPQKPTCLSSSNNPKCKQPDGFGQVTIELTKHSEHYSIIACNRHKTSSNHFKDLPSEEVNGYTGNSNYPDQGSFFHNDFNLGSTAKEQVCYENDVKTDFLTFEATNAPTDAASHKPSQTVHTLKTTLHVSPATNDTSGAGMGRMLYGFNIAPANVEADVMSSSECGCQEETNAAAEEFDTITKATTRGLELLQTPTVGLYSIKKVSDALYRLQECAFTLSSIEQHESWRSNNPAGAVGLAPGYLHTKPATDSMCLRKLSADADTWHLMATRTSASLSSTRMVDNFADPEQPPNDLTCVRLADASIHKGIVQGKDVFPLSGFQLKTALSAESRSHVSPSGKHVPKVKVIQATAGSSLCRNPDAKDFQTGAQGATSPNTGFKAIASNCNEDNSNCFSNSTSCPAGQNTFGAIIGIGMSGTLSSTVGDGAQLSSDEMYNLKLPPEWTIGHDNVLHNCVLQRIDTVHRNNMQPAQVARFLCDFTAGTRQAGGAIYKQPLQACIKSVVVSTSTGTSVRYYSTGRPGAARILARDTGSDTIEGKTCQDPGSLHKVVVSKWFEVDTLPHNVKQNTTQYLIEAPNFPEYDGNHEDSTDAYTHFGAFVKSKTNHGILGPSTSLRFSVAHVSGDQHRLEAHLQGGHVGMAVMACGTESTTYKAGNANLNSPTANGELTPSWIRQDFLDKGQRIGETSNRVEMAPYCSNAIDKSCQLGTNGEPRPDAACGLDDDGEPKQCGVRKISLSITATNNYFFQRQYNAEPQDSVSKVEYLGYVGPTSIKAGAQGGQAPDSFGNSVWFKVDQDPTQNRQHGFNSLGESYSQASYMGPNVWAVQSWRQSSPAEGSSATAQLDNGMLTREVSFGVTILELANEDRLSWDSSRMEPYLDVPGGGQSLLTVRCPLPSTKVTKIVSAISTDLSIQQQATVTNYDRQLVRSAQWMSFQTTRRFTRNTLNAAADTDSAGEIVESSGKYEAVDNMGNHQEYLSGRPEGSSDGLHVIKVRLQTSLVSPDSPASISHAKELRLEATLSSQDAGSDMAAGSKRTCRFRSVADHTLLNVPNNGASPVEYLHETQLDSTCLLQSAEVLELLRTNATNYDYYAPKCGVTASSVKQAGSHQCSVITDQGIDFALENSQHNRDNCPYFAGLHFESAVLSGIDLTVYSDVENNYADCGDPNDATFWYLKEQPTDSAGGPSSNSKIEMCSVRAAGVQCGPTSQQFQMFNVPMSGIDTKISDAVLDVTESVYQLEAYTVSTQARLGIIHPAMKLKDTGDKGGHPVVLDKATIEGIPLIEHTANEHTAKLADRNKPHQPNYLTLAPSCNDDSDDSADAENRKRNAMNSLCNCPASGVWSELAIPPKDPKRGYSTFGLNKPAGKTAIVSEQWGQASVTPGVLSAKTRTTAIHASAAVQPGVNINPYTSFINFNTETFVQERSRMQGTRPQIEVGLLYACLTPRTSSVQVIPGVEVSEEMPLYARSGVSNQRKPLCEAHEAIAYLHFGSQDAFETMVSATKYHLAIPRCTADRQTPPSGVDQRLGHGQATAQGDSVGQVFDLSPNVKSAVQTVESDCTRSKQSKEFNPLKAVVGKYHKAYTNDFQCIKDGTEAAYEAARTTFHDHDIYSEDFWNEAKELKAYAMDMKSTGKYALFVNEAFEESGSAYSVSTATVDAKLFGSYASAVTFKQIVLVTSEDDTGRRSQKAIMNTKRHLLTTGDGSQQSNILHSSTSSVPKCQSATGALNNIEVSGNGTVTYCASFTCSSQNQLRISARDGSGLEFDLDCTAKSTSASSKEDDDNRDVIIWLSLGLAILALVITCSILTHYGYTQIWLKKAEEKVSVVLDDIKSVL